MRDPRFPDPSPEPAPVDDAIAEQGIAVVGLAGRFPGAADPNALWEHLRRGDELIEHFPPEAVDDPDVTPEEAAAPDYVRARGVLDDVDRFDAGFFGYGAREAEILDPQLRLFLETCWHALENAGYAGRASDGLTGVYAGASPNTYAWNHLAHHPELARTLGRYQLLLGNEKDFLATSVSFRLDLRGPSMTVQSACSTSLVAVHLAALALASYDCDLALAGGVSVQLPQRAGHVYEEGGILSPDGHCRAFDAEARGMVGGSGVGVVVLKRLADALADGDSVRAVLLGTAVNNDGALKVGYTAPSLEGQAEAVAAAQAVADVDPETISYIEAHGTGTPLGDPIEVAALTRVFRAATERRGFCALGSIKTNVGHLDAAAGVTGLIKAVLALERGEIPPSLHFRRPNPRLELDTSPFYVPDRLVPWERGDAPRRAGVSSFGIGGTNAHAVLQEAPPVPGPEPGRRWQILPVSAREPETLERLTERIAEHLATGTPEEAGPPSALPDVAYTLQVGRGQLDHRRVALARDEAEAVRALRGELPGQLLAAITTERRRPVCFLVPGQGNRLCGAGRAVYDSEPTFRDAVDRCSSLLEPHLSLELRSLLYPPSPPAADGEDAGALLAQTRFAQPTLFTLAWASARLWAGWGVEPEGILGHSVGELVAACLGGLFRLEDALALVAERGRLMHELPPGAMAAVGLSVEEVEPLLGDGLSLAAVNAPRLVTVAGRAAEIEALERRLADPAEAPGREGDDAPLFRRLDTAHAFHSPDVDAVADRFAAAVERVPRSAPGRPWVSSLTGDWIDPEEVRSPEYWARHLRRTVRFSDGLETLIRAWPTAAFVEIGPGRSLLSLLRRQPNGRQKVAVATLPSPRTTERGPDDASDGEAEHGQRELAAAVARLWLAGVDVDWDARARPRRRRRVPLPSYPFARRRYWIEGRPPLQGRGPAGRSPGAGSAEPEAAPERPVETAPAAPTGDRHPRPELAVPHVAPRDTTETVLTEVWEDLLGVAGIGVHDDFFELGGHSLLALRLAAHLEQRFGTRLETAAVAEAPTVAGQAELVRGAEAAPSSLLVPLGEAARSLLRRDAPAGDAGPPLVLVHPIGGGVLAYRELANRIERATGVAVFGLRAPGHEAGEEPVASIPELAARHLETVRRALGTTPLRLGGWSFGGVVAFEMGRLLRAEDGVRGPLVLLDSAPAVDDDGAAPGEADLVAAFAQDLLRAGEAPAGPGEGAAPSRRLEALAVGGDLDELLAAAVSEGLLPDGAEERARRLFELFRTHAAALAAHRPHPWQTDVLLVEAASREPDTPRPRDRWSPLVEGHLDVAEIQGDHYSILSPPAVDRVAARLADALREPDEATHARGD